MSFYGQTGVKTETFTVRGNCDDCKERIENAADIKGVKLTKWDADKQVATVTYDPSKTDVRKVQQAIANGGYDAGDIKAPAKAYNRLPDCCKYRDKKCEEPSGKK
jgi:periplasmic mercuric ion binding protein